MVSRSLVLAVAITASTSTSGPQTAHAFSPCHQRVVISHVTPGTSSTVNTLNTHHKHPSVGNGKCRGDVTMQMGFRSFIKRKILRRGGGDDDTQDDVHEDSTSSSSAPEEINLRTVIQNQSSSTLRDNPEDGVTDNNGDGGSSSSKRRRNDDTTSRDTKQRLQEDANARIKRVKSGGMTEEEKLSFLNAALTSTSPAKKPRGPPIRQRIPGLDDEVVTASSSLGENKKVSGSVKGNSGGGGGNSKSDNLWNAITGKKGAGSKSSSSSSGGKSDYVPVSSLILDGKLRNEEAKRQWIDSITSPDRFASFSSIKRSESAVRVDETATASELSEIEAEEENASFDTIANDKQPDSGYASTTTTSSASEQDFTQLKRKMIEDQEILLQKPKVEKPGEKSVREALESILAMTGSNNNNNKTSSPNSAGGAKKDNDLAARLEKAAVEQETRDAENRLAADKRKEEERQALLEAQKKREAEYQRKETERMEEARKKAEQLRLDQQAKEEAERAKVQAAIAAQEAYWEEQLKKQQAKRGSSMSMQERRELEQQKIVQAMESDERFERDVAKDVKIEQIREEERKREPEHEGEILKENDASILEYSTIITLALCTKAEQRKLKDRELARDIIDESAARVSHTVKPTAKGDASVSAFVMEQRRKKEEIDKLAEIQQQRLKMLNSPLTPPKKQPVRMTVPVPPPAPRPAPATSSSSTPELSLSSLTMKKDAQSSPNPPATAPPAASSSSPALSLSSLTMKKNTQTTNIQDNSASAARKRPLKKTVRQQLPISSQFDDDDEEDDDNLMNKGGAGLTVADALKQQQKDGGGGSKKSSGGGKKIDANDRAKQWGIDMSKFK
eukprot:scaffold19153_cov52-Cyclotella_meneghiniana.AAC.1